MSEGRILIVEDDHDTAKMLADYFSELGFLTQVADRGTTALDYTRRRLPDLIILDILLPEMNGYAVCRTLRTTTRTSHIPIIFLTQKDELSDIIAGLELGADDYITKPFDIKELELRVKNALASHRRMNMTDPRTGLPASRLIEDQLRQLIQSDGWTYIEIAIQNMQPFQDKYGFVAGDEVLRYVALLLNETIEIFGTSDDFVGHAGGPIFTIITYTSDIEALRSQVEERFNNEITTHYNFMDIEEGGIVLPDRTIAPIMAISFGIVSDGAMSYSDIREITEAAAAARLRNQQSKGD